MLEYRGKGEGQVTLSYRLATVVGVPLHYVICPGSEGHTMPITIFGAVPEHVLKCSILMKQRINVLQFRVGGKVKEKEKKKEGGFCFLSRKVYINNFPSRPSVVLLQTTTAFVSQILLHLTLDQSPHISSSPRRKKV